MPYIPMLHILLKRFLIKSTQAQTLLPYTHTISIYLGGFLIKSVWIKNSLFHTQRVSNCCELWLAFPLTYVQTSQLRTKLFTLTIICFKTRSRENNEISGSDSTMLVLWIKQSPSPCTYLWKETAEEKQININANRVMLKRMLFKKV